MSGFALPELITGTFFSKEMGDRPELHELYEEPLERRVAHTSIHLHVHLYLRAISPISVFCIDAYMRRRVESSGERETGRN